MKRIQYNIHDGFHRILFAREWWLTLLCPQAHPRCSPLQTICWWCSSSFAFSNQASYLWCPRFIHCSMPSTWMGVGILFPGCGDAQNFINDLLVEMHANAMACAAEDILESSNDSMMKYFIKMFEDKYNILLSIHIHLIGFICAIKCSFIGLHNFTYESYWCTMFCVM